MKKYMAIVACLVAVLVFACAEIPNEEIPGTQSGDTVIDPGEVIGDTTSNWCYDYQTGESYPCDPMNWCYDYETLEIYQCEEEIGGD